MDRILIVWCVVCLMGVAQTEEAPKPPRSALETHVLQSCLGQSTEHQAIHEVPVATWWSDHRVFRVVNFTWPHAPGSYVVARPPDGPVWVVSALTDGLRDPDGPACFNRVARAEKKAIPDDRAFAYAAFALDMMLGEWEPHRWLGTAEDVTRTRAAMKLRDPARPAPPVLGGFDPTSAHWEPTSAGWRLRGWYAGATTVHAVQLEIDRADGSIRWSCATEAL